MMMMIRLMVRACVPSTVTDDESRSMPSSFFTVSVYRPVSDGRASEMTRVAEEESDCVCIRSSVYIKVGSNVVDSRFIKYSAPAIHVCYSTHARMSHDA